MSKSINCDEKIHWTLISSVLISLSSFKWRCNVCSESIGKLYWDDKCVSATLRYWNKPAWLFSFLKINENWMLRNKSNIFRVDGGKDWKKPRKLLQQCATMRSAHWCSFLEFYGWHSVCLLVHKILNRCVWYMVCWRIKYYIKMKIEKKVINMYGYQFCFF